jgi:ABC-2 type transport system ATP-binding protein
MSNIIELQSINKTFGLGKSKLKALDDLTFEVKQGEVMGFLGPNGAGKSTTIRVLLGLIKADSGQAKLLNQDPWKNPAELHKKLAYVPGEVNFWPALTGGETIDFLAKIRDINTKDPNYTRQKDQLIEKFVFDPSKKNKTYSKGNKQKIALISAFLSTLTSHVPLLILDEPTSGLNPLMEDIFQKELLAYKQQGNTVLLSSHIMSEIQDLSDRVTLIKSGHVVLSDTIEEITNGINKDKTLEEIFLKEYEQ